MNDENTQTKDTTRADNGASSTTDMAAAFAAATSLSVPDEAPAAEPEFDQRKAVNDGRLKKLAEENKELQAKLAEMQKRIEESERRKQDDDLLGVEGAENFDEETKKFMAGAINRATDRLSSKLNSKIAEIEQRSTAAVEAARRRRIAETQTETAAAIEQAYPGFFRRITNGGDLEAAYKRFLGETDDYAGRTHVQLLADALAGGRTGGARKVLEKFIEENGLSGQYQVQTGAPRSAAPANPAGAGAGGKKTYPSREAVEKALETIAQQYRKGLIDRKSYDARSEELEDALRSGRYLK